MTEFQKKAAITALQNMFESSGFFSICTIDKVLKLTGCIPDQKDYQALSLLHCVSWRDMDAEMRNMVMLKTMQMFESPGFDMRLINAAFEKDTFLLN